MSNKNMFLFSTMAQVNYFSQVGRLIAEQNYTNRSKKLISKEKEDNAICVIIPVSYGQHADLLTSARRAWQIGKKEFDKKSIKYLFAIYENVIVGVYQLTKDNSVVKSYEEDRWEFNLQIAELPMQNKWLGVRLDGKSLQGNVIHYAYFETE